MHIIINHSSMIPIYEQIMDQIKGAILSGELRENDNLPSVRAVAKELKISALTVKKAYDFLEEEGMTVTIHGKGTYVSAANQALIREEKCRVLEQQLQQAVEKARNSGITDAEIRELFAIIMEEA